MTWCKLGDEFPDDLAEVELSDTAFRLHVEGLCWTMKRESGGLIRAHELRRLTAIENPETGLKELLDVEYWETIDQPRGWLIRHHMNHQRTPEQIAKDRDDAKVRKARSRAAAKRKESRRDS